LGEAEWKSIRKWRIGWTREHRFKRRLKECGSRRLKIEKCQVKRGKY